MRFSSPSRLTVLQSSKGTPLSRHYTHSYIIFSRQQMADSLIWISLLFAVSHYYLELCTNANVFMQFFMVGSSLCVRVYCVDTYCQATSSTKTCFQTFLNGNVFRLPNFVFNDFFEARANENAVTCTHGRWTTFSSKLAALSPSRQLRFYLHLQFFHSHGLIT